MPLKPVLGPVHLVFYSVGVIVGAGVYSVIGSAAGLALGQLWLSFLVSAGVALLTAISYAEMATAFPAAGAEYLYIRNAWPRAPWLSFGVGIVILLGGAATAATVALAFGGYLLNFVDVPVTASALALLIACTALSIYGLRESSWVNIAFTSIEVGGLLLVVAAGYFADAPAPVTGPTNEPAVMAAAALLFFVYLGFEEIANLSEEVRRPGRDIPLALLASLGVTTVLYVLVAISVTALLPPQILAQSNAPLATAIEAAWPGAGHTMTAIALFATANTVLITIIAISRMAFSMGRDGELPRLFGQILPARRTPWIASLFTLAMAGVLLPAGGIATLAEMSSFAALLAFLSVNAALIALRYRMPDQPRPFRVPIAFGRLPLPPAIAIVSIGVLLAYFEWPIYAAGAVAILLSAAAYFARSAWRRITAD